MTYSAYLEDEVQEEVLPTCIPHLELAQHMDDWINSVWEILLDPLAPTELSESALHSLICYVSKFFLMDGKLMHRDFQGCHKVVILKEK